MKTLKDFETVDLEILIGMPLPEPKERIARHAGILSFLNEHYYNLLEPWLGPPYFVNKSSDQIRRMVSHPQKYQASLQNDE